MKHGFTDMTVRKKCAVVSVIALLLVLSFTVAIPEASAFFHGVPPMPIKLIPLNFALVQGTRINNDLAGANGVAGWLRGVWEIINIINEKNDIWRQAGIQFYLGYILINVPDPNPPPPVGTGPGVLGDIYDPQLDGEAEFQALCREIDDNWTGAMYGVWEIKIHDFVNGAGGITDLLGWSSVIPVHSEKVPLKEASCEPAEFEPGMPHANAGVGGPPNGPHWTPGYVEAHEVGHLLTLEHADDIPANQPRLMYPFLDRPNADALLNANEILAARNYADDDVSGTVVVDPLGHIISILRRSSASIVGSLLAVPYGFLKIFDFISTFNLDNASAYFAITTNGLLPYNIENVSYSFYMNLDGSAATGISSEIAGVDAIAQVLVSEVSGTPQVSYNLTLFDSENHPIRIVDSSIEAGMDTLEGQGYAENESRSAQPWGERIYISIPEKILSSYVPIVDNCPVVADTSWNATSDISPILHASLTIPQHALMTISPASGLPGQTVSVSGVNFTPNSSLWVLFENIKLAEVAVDNSGRFSTTVTIPTNVEFGYYSLWAFSPLEEHANGDLRLFDVAPPVPVGGIAVPTSKLGLLAPYIAYKLGLVSAILVAGAATTVIYVKGVKRRKDKQ